VTRSCLDALLPIAGKGCEAATLFDYLSGREDACKVASIRAALTLAMLNNAVLLLVDRAGTRNARSAMRLFAAKPHKTLDLIFSPCDF
jgi:hypothetical protein